MRYSGLGASWEGRRGKKSLAWWPPLHERKITKNKIEITHSYKTYRDIMLQIKNPLML